ncbi:HNH endonuclease (plasmid) [Tundrisphaera sp. TA3]|uniref:HNH endonuclease n=1 Tax=Tundrisphaera sp. TA3 TaxID=3435775 RepID=UPI003EBDE828
MMNSPTDSPTDNPLDYLSPVPGYPAYFINPARREVHRRYPDGKLRPVKAVVNGHGYRHLNLCRDGKCRSVKLCRLVAEAVYGPLPPGLGVLHRNDVKTDDLAANLYYGSPADNRRDALRNGRLRTKLNPDKVRAIFALDAAGVPRKVAAATMGVGTNTIGDVLRGRTWGHVRNNPDREG